VGDLLSLARRGISTKSIVNCNDLIKEYLASPEFLHLKNQHPNVCFLPDLDPALMNITGAPVQLAKCLMNLVSNAAESIRGAGDVRIRSSNHYVDQSTAMHCGLKEGDFVSISVADTGAGIDSKDREHIFEPFYTKKKMGRSGSGLGLAVVWSTVQEHQGQILVDSEMEKGTIFTMHLPASRAKLATAPFVKSHAAYRGNGEHILIVDDVGEQREIASAILAQLGYRVAAAANGEEAITYLSRRQVDLVLLDMIMPGMDGLETYKRILRIRPGQRALVVSGYSENSRVSKTLELGAGALVKKPYLIETLGLAIRKELSVSSPQATL
jgi:CheY-like chemotaxis protein